LYFQLINITSQNVFKKYSKTYNIFRDLYEVGSFGLEVSLLDNEKAVEINRLFLKNGDFSYLQEIDSSKSNLLAIGSFHKLKDNAKLVKSKVNEEIGHRMINTISNYELYNKSFISVKGKKYLNSEVNIMGILNVTPDSFSDGGNYFLHENAINFAKEMIEEGVDIIDVGGESTRPGAMQVSEDEELKRVLPVIEKLHTLYPYLSISIDTTKSKVAEMACKAGASIINDVSAATFDESILQVAIENEAAIILMHMQGTPKTMQDSPQYSDVIKDIYKTLLDRVQEAKQLGIKNIIIDPGFGFGKELHHNYEILERLDEFKCIGYPILAGLSRKSMLGRSLELKIDERDTATIISETIAVQNGASFIRTHNVKNAVQLKKISSFVNNPGVLKNV
jgi:dihydropteroate synthase